jgi:ABC-type uncharacterized transport system substrate-binding protein
MAREIDMAMTRMRPLPCALALAILCGVLATPAKAHPHVWITFETTVLHEKGTFVGVRHKWTFDEFYTTMAIEGLDKNKDGIYDREELAELAKVNIDGLKDFSYFTFPALAGKELKIGEAKDYWLEHKDGTLSLHFTVNFASPVLMEAKGLTVSVYDPTYFIAFEMAKTDPVKLAEGAPKGCVAKAGVPPAQKPDQASAKDTLQTQLGAFGVTIAKTILVECSGP